MLIKVFSIAFLSVFISISSWAASLTPEQQLAKDKGLALYNQYKAVSAEPYLEIAAKAGDREAQYFLGEAIRLNSRSMTADAYKWYAAAAEQGDYYAMYRLSGTKSDLCSAMDSCPPGEKTQGEWLLLGRKTAQDLADAGDGEAMYVLYYLTNNFDWMERSAEAGFSVAQYKLARLYDQGEGFFFPPWKRAEAVERLMEKSARGGYVKAMDYSMGLQYRKDNDEEKYISNVEVIAKTGYVSGVFGYGSILQNKYGDYKIEPDLVRSYGLMSLVAALDGGGAEPDYAQDIIESELAPKMNSKQIKKAKIFAEQWEKENPPLSFFPDKLGF